jgi:hypothetical protein
MTHPPLGSTACPRARAAYAGLAALWTLGRTDLRMQEDPALGRAGSRS